VVAHGKNMTEFMYADYAYDPCRETYDLRAEVCIRE
jgi:hypothetical protein